MSETLIDCPLCTTYYTGDHQKCPECGAVSPVGGRIVFVCLFRSGNMAVCDWDGQVPSEQKAGVDDAGFDLAIRSMARSGKLQRDSQVWHWRRGKFALLDYIDRFIRTGVGE